MLERSALTRYKQIKFNYGKLVQQASKKYDWGTAKFMDLVAWLYERRDRELERFIVIHVKS